ncbi:MAG: DUF4230 domain-containing protein [Oscillospiraceae bacterium]|nr:DUF4230 domain-containing protein [Oscillospiraceae bacterium]
MKVEKGRKKYGIHLLVLIAVVILLYLLVDAHNQQKELREQLAASVEQVEQQWKIIEALREQQEQNDSLIKDSVPVVTSDQLKAELNSIQELVTQQYIYTNADRVEQNQTWIFGWDMPFSAKSLLITYDGVIKAGIDLSNIEVDVDEDARTILITLPSSKITDNNIPQETITVLEVNDGLFNKVTFEDYNDFISSQKVIMENKAVDRGLLDNADKMARSIIVDFLSKIPGVEEYTLEIKQSPR